MTELGWTRYVSEWVRQAPEVSRHSRKGRGTQERAKSQRYGKGKGTGLKTGRYSAATFGEEAGGWKVWMKLNLNPHPGGAQGAAPGSRQGASGTEKAREPV